MAPRNPYRPKAAHIPNHEILAACERYADRGIPHPAQHLSGFPAKVVLAKLAKLNARGLVDREGRITRTGRAALTEMLEAAS